MSNKFRNPYNFVPLRAGKICDQLAAGTPEKPRKPAGHNRYHEDLWSGRIEIDIETVTPLLIPDAANVNVEKSGEAKGHKTFDVRKDPNGRPLLPVTALKGPLRSAYEMVTNSRFGVFNLKEHEAQVFRRMKTEEALPLIPARVSDCGSEFNMLPGRRAFVEVETEFFDKKTGQKKKKKLWTQSAAWLPRYSWPNGPNNEVSESKGKAYEGSGELPGHDDEVICELVLKTKHQRFAYWQVKRIWPASASKHPELDDQKGRTEFQLNDTIVVKGWVCITGPSIGNKHDERVFFSTPTSPSRSVTIPKEVSERWRNIVSEYQERHKDALKERRDKTHRADWAYGKDVGKTAFSRHVWERGAERLTPKTFCHVLEDKAEPVAAYPVMIGREVGDNVPKDLLPKKFLPAREFHQFSPADRVFGWVNQNAGDGRNAYKGQLRIHNIKCEAEPNEAIEPFDPPLPLTILGEPKISQLRFYVGDADGSPLKKGEDTTKAGYFDNEGPKAWLLRGRKIYHHHAVTLKADGYWKKKEASDDATSATPKLVAEFEETIDGVTVQQKIYREYIRHPSDKGNKDKQNRSIKAWVKPGTKFTAVIDVVNLNDAELGVLLWLLDLERECDGATPYHRIGGGKPLGFGSIKISIKSLDLQTGAARRERYFNLFAKHDEAGVKEKLGPCVIRGGSAAADTFMGGVFGPIEKKNNTEFQHLPHVAAFLQAARGYEDDIPTHYPRLDTHPNPAGENFKWFGANENGRKIAGERRSRNGLKLALPALESASGEETALLIDPIETQ